MQLGEIMYGRSCYFYADEEDLADLTRALKGLGNYKFVQIRSNLNQPNLIFSDPTELLPLAMVTPSNPTRIASFLIVHNDQQIFEREIALKDGSGFIKIVDQNQNWNSVVLAFGGNCEENTLIMSDINTVGDTEIALTMHNKFKKLVVTKTIKIGKKGSPHRLMPGAVEKLKSGWRLASDKNWSRCTDANIPAEEIAKI
jgi:hypothetical protein